MESWRHLVIAAGPVRLPGVSSFWLRGRQKSCNLQACGDSQAACRPCWLPFVGTAQTARAGSQAGEPAEWGLGALPPYPARWLRGPEGQKSRELGMSAALGSETRDKKSRWGQSLTGRKRLLWDHFWWAPSFPKYFLKNLKYFLNILKYFWNLWIFSGSSEIFSEYSKIVSGIPEIFLNILKYFQEFRKYFQNLSPQGPTRK